MTAVEHELGRRAGEFSWAKKTADEYRARGYEVALEADVDFLPGYRLDLVACKGDDRRIVEVKRRSSLRHDSRIDEIARTIEAQPGWSLDIVLVPETPQLAAPQGSRPLGIDEALQRVSGAEHLLQAGSTESSMLVAWSACEAVIRTLLEVETEVRDEVSPTSQLIDSATMHGVISHEHRDYLKQLLPLRNAVAHGMSHADVQVAAVSGLLEFIHQVVAEALSDEDDATGSP